jgi:cell shape-determining protein MreD
VETSTPPAAPQPPAKRRADGWLPFILVVTALCAGFTIDPVKTPHAIKGDEATYVSMALSAAFEWHLSFERQDLERFWAAYECGPDGIFLKRGKLVRLKMMGRPPFIRLVYGGDAPPDRLYYGKAFVYPVVAAPLVRLFGVRGLLLTNLALLGLVAWCGYCFAAARAPANAAMAFTVAFFGASIVPLYVIWYTPEIFNLSAVFVAYFLWLYKEVAPPTTGRFAGLLRGRWSDFAAAGLIGVVTFSKPTHVLLIAPIVALLWWRRRWVRGLLALVAFTVVCGGLFGVNGAISGELNYQGGDRKVFYTWFPFASPDATFDTARGGHLVSTNDADTENVFESGVFLPRLARNGYYFVVGRHAGFVPYFFPGAVVIGFWLWRRREIRLWQALVFASVAASVVAILVMMPYTWAGGGGPPGNRYFLSFYPALFFLVPAFGSVRPAMVAWAGGALFTAQALVNPFFVAKYPYWNVDHGAYRLLPIELTMVNDLPVMLDRNRVKIPVGQNPTLSLYLIDENVYAPEPAGIWVHGERRADIVFRAASPLSCLRVTVLSLVRNTVWLSFDGRSATINLKPGASADVVFSTTGGVYSEQGWGYVLSVKTAAGVVPMIHDKDTTDDRFLGALLKLQGVERPKR